MKNFSLVPFALALVACSSGGSNVDLGDNETAKTGQSLSDYEGTWDGYVEAYQFESGSDRLRVALDQNGHGAIQFGDAPPIPPFSNPDLGYPPGTPINFLEYSAEVPEEGFDYPLYDASVTQGRIKFTVWGTDIAADFCAAQTHILPSLAYPSGYTCSLVGDSWAMDDEDTCRGSFPGAGPVDCGQVQTCQKACICSATSCTTLRRPERALVFDGVLRDSGHSLEGTLVAPNERLTVRVTRQ